MPVHPTSYFPSRLSLGASCESPRLATSLLAMISRRHEMLPSQGLRVVVAAYASLSCEKQKLG